jgi:hypothetical protein
MSQKNSEILGDGWIIPSLVESEYFGLILTEDSITPVDSIVPVDSIDLVGSIDSVSSIASQKKDFDSLTGMATKSTSNAEGYIYNGGVTLKDAWLGIVPIYNTSNARVTVTIKVELDTPVNSVMNPPTNLTLQSTVWGVDGDITNGFDFFNRDDHLFDFPTQKITQGGYYTFEKDVPRSALDEDHSWFDKRDEIGATITLVNSAGTEPANKKVWTNQFISRF